MTITEFLRARAAGDEAVERLLKDITAFQERTATRMAGILGDLEISGGRLVASEANMARLSRVIAELESGFADGKWQKARDSYLKAHPLCVMHMERGEYAAATVVDHIIPHKGDQHLFWSQGNWQSLCKPCHDIHKQRQERAAMSSQPPQGASIL